MAVTARSSAGAAAVARGAVRAAVRESPFVDCGFLAAVVVISVLPYVAGLGFYYDDYAFLERMTLAHDHSLWGLYHAVRPPTGQRPLQALTLAVLYRLFGLNALGYHLFNAGLLVGVACLLYLILRELRVPRVIAVAVPLVYAVLPQYATNRFWVATFQITLSTALYLLSLYAALRAVRAGPAALSGWLVVAGAAAVGSLFAYEILFPLFALAVALVWWAARVRRAPRVRSYVSAGALAAVVAAAGIVKVTRVADQGLNGYQVGLHDGLVHHVAFLVSGAIRLNAGTYFVGVPYVLWWIVAHRLSLANVAAAGAAGAFSFVYVWRVARRDPAALGTATGRRAWFAVGVLAFVLGYAIFLTNDVIVFRSAGLDNRVNAGAALGVAVLLVAGASWLVARRARRRPAAAFAAAIGSIVTAGVLVVVTLGSFWTAAAARQQTILTAFRAAKPSLAPSSTVILDGVCPEVGPAVVFAKQWDFRGRLQIAYREGSIAADIAAEALHARPRRLALQMTFLGNRTTRSYRYGPQLLVYDFRDRRIHVLRDESAARRYVAAERPRFTCPPLRSFAWGLDPTGRFSLP